jgi:hypothetical protein
MKMRSELKTASPADHKKEDDLEGKPYFLLRTSATIQGVWHFRGFRM